MKSRYFHILSLGCPKNLIDSEVMAGILTDSGYKLLNSPDDAHIIIVNTCAFILPAKEESIDEILRMSEFKKEGRGACVYLVVTGCLVQRYGKILEKELPEVDLFLGVGEIPHITFHLDRLTAMKTGGNRSIIKKPTFLMNAGHRRIIATPAYTAYLKIAEGCSNRCSYCVIPAIRGKARSRKMDDILAEAERLAQNGVKEIILIAQDTTAYGCDMKKKDALNDLLKALASMQKIHWLRFLYTYPSSLTDRMLKTIAAEEKICSYIDMPIQHIDDDLLKTMNRKSGSRMIKKTIEKARTIIPDVALRTSVIVGFPGETQRRFNRLLAFIREIRFDHLGAFIYSKEEGTRAASLLSPISEKEKETRKQLIMEEQSIISYEINQSLIASMQEVLIEGKSDLEVFPFVGRCRRQAPEIDGITYVKGKNLASGDFVLCRITSANEYDLFAETVK